MAYRVADYPPRRLSVREQWALPDARFIEVYLDGAKQSKVISYDIDAGTVHRFQTNAQGRIRVDLANGRAFEETLTGIVTVEWRQPCAA